MRSTDPGKALTAATRVTYEVFRGGASTRRKFSSLPAAQRYADAVGGEVRAT